MAEFVHSDPNPICEFVTDIQNLTDHQIADLPIFKPEVDLLIKTFVPIVFVIGCIGNVGFLLLPARVKTMRTITNVYLANLAVADLMILLVQTFVESWRNIISFKQSISEPFHTNIGCGFSYFMRYVSSCASTLLITLVGVERYFAVCHPLKYRTRKNKKQTCCILTLTAWTISATFGILGILSFSRLAHYCILWPSREEFKHYSKVIKFCGPIYQICLNISLPVYEALNISALMTNFIINIRILQRLTRPPPGENENQQNQQIRRRITWMILINSAVFCCCMVPINFINLMHLLNISFAQNLGYVAFVFRMLNSTVNPILYGLISPSYRRGFLKAFGFRKNIVEPIEPIVN